MAGPRFEPPTRIRDRLHRVREPTRRGSTRSSRGRHPVECGDLESTGAACQATAGDTAGIDGSARDVEARWLEAKRLAGAEDRIGRKAGTLGDREDLRSIDHGAAVRAAVGDPGFGVGGVGHRRGIEAPLAEARVAVGVRRGGTVGPAARPCGAGAGRGSPHSGTRRRGTAGSFASRAGSSGSGSPNRHAS